MSYIVNATLVWTAANPYTALIAVSNSKPRARVSGGDNSERRCVVGVTNPLTP